jgi:hypothetical protein
MVFLKTRKSYGNFLAKNGGNLTELRISALSGRGQEIVFLYGSAAGHAYNPEKDSKSNQQQNQYHLMLFFQEGFQGGTE